MTLPTGGALTLPMVQGEFGGGNPISMSEYYAGGGLVPGGTSGTYGAVPSSGTIHMYQFYGTTSIVYGTVALSNHSFVVTGQTFSNTATINSTLFFNSSGSLTATGGGTGIDITPTSANYSGEWLTGGWANSVSVKATLTGSSGTPTSSSGTFDTWLTLDTTRSWGVNKSRAGSALGYAERHILFQLAHTNNTSNILASATIYIGAQATNS